LKKHYDTKNLMIVSPDVGGVAPGSRHRQAHWCRSIAIVDKRRPRAGVSEVMNIIGDVVRAKLSSDR